MKEFMFQYEDDDDGDWIAVSVSEFYSEQALVSITPFEVGAEALMVLLDSDARKRLAAFLLSDVFHED